MEHSKIVNLVNTDAVVQLLLESPVPMRLGYIGIDGYPRVSPVAYIWNGNAFVFASLPTSYKVKSIAANPMVAFTVDVAGPQAAELRTKVTDIVGVPYDDYLPLLVTGHGKASFVVKPGIPQEHIDASRRLVGDDRKAEEWVRIKRKAWSEMAVVSIIPSHMLVSDYVTRFPRQMGPPRQDPVDVGRAADG